MEILEHAAGRNALWELFMRVRGEPNKRMGDDLRVCDELSEG